MAAGLTRRGARRVCAAALTVLLAAGAGSAVPAGPDEPPATEAEYRVKAAFLYNFARFVEWPDSSDRVMRVCVLPPDPFGDVLERTVDGKAARGMPFEIVRPERFEADAACDIVFAGRIGARREAGLLDAVRGHAVLTVGDDSPFAERGGVINFVVDGGRVGFEINRAAADRAGLRLSSKLLGLARLVDDRAAAGGRP